MIYGIVGSRKRKDKQAVIDFVKSLPVNSVVVSGGCDGVDTWSILAAENCGLSTKVFYPDLSNCKQSFEFTRAYYARNLKIAEYCDILVAFVSDDRKGGTENTIKHAKKLKKEIIIK